jgi:tryptophan synthase alpha chain
MSVINELFESLHGEGQLALMPFVTAGYPDLDFTYDLLSALSAAGCQIVELGFPYSDPIADGPVIQASYQRALQNSVTVERIFEMLSARHSNTLIPVVGMVSYAIIFRFGTERFLSRSKDAGLAGLIIPDLPFEESLPVNELCRRHDLHLIQLVTPTTESVRAAEIARASSGFVYCVSTTGVTGERNHLPEPLLQRIQWLKSQTHIPICVGFGIREPEQVRLLKKHADGVIVGSALVKRIAEIEAHHDRNRALREVIDFVHQILAVCK